MKRTLRFLSNVVAATLVGAAPLPVVRAQLPTVSIKAVVINPFCIGGANAGALCMDDAQCDSGVCGTSIEPTSHVVANPGDIIVAEVFASDWSPAGEQLRGYSFTLTSRALRAAACSNLELLFVPRPCSANGDCAAVDPAAFCFSGFCESQCRCEAFGEIDTLRFDFAFFLRSSFVALDPQIPDFIRLLGALAQLNDATSYSGTPTYLATVRYRLPVTARGDYEIHFADGPDLVTRDGTFITPLVVETLVVSAGGEMCPLFVGSNPPSCTVETTQPEDPETPGLGGRDSLELTLLEPLSPRELTIYVSPPVDFPPRIISVDGLDPAILLFDRPIPPGHWTCIERIVLTQDTVCIGSLPGDVNGDRISTEADVEDLRSECLPELLGCDARRCDVDGSGQCTPADLLRVIDLLNGAIGGEAWLDRTIDPCPFQFP